MANNKIIKNTPGLSSKEAHKRLIQYGLNEMTYMPGMEAAVMVNNISYEYISSVMSECLGDKANQRIIATHLESGASMCVMYQKN